jgi:hypothetical protein
VLKEAFNAAGYRGYEEGVCHLMGGMKEEATRRFFPSAEVVEGGHGGGVRPATGGGLRVLLRCRRKKPARPKRSSGLVRPAGPKARSECE